MPFPKVSIDVSLAVPNVFVGFVLPIHVITKSVVHVEWACYLGARVCLEKVMRLMEVHCRNVDLKTPPVLF